MRRTTNVRGRQTERLRLAELRRLAFLYVVINDVTTRGNPSVNALVYFRDRVHWSVVSWFQTFGQPTERLLPGEL